MSGLGDLQSPVVRIAADFACRGALTNHCSPREGFISVGHVSQVVLKEQ